MGQQFQTCKVASGKDCSSNLLPESKKGEGPSKKAQFTYINAKSSEEETPVEDMVIASFTNLAKIDMEGSETTDEQIDSLSSQTLRVIKSVKDVKIKWDSLTRMKEKSYLQDYEIEKKAIGRGSFGVVRSVRCKRTKLLRVAKIIRKRLMKQEDATKLFNELAIVKHLDNPNIVKIFEVYDYGQEFVVIIEMCRGGEVHSKTKNKRVSEERAQRIIKQTLRGITYIHSENLVHRDINTRNMIFQNQDQKVVKLIDFGFATRLGPETEFLSQRIGCPSYIAPEIIYKQYNQKVDIWALGVSFYELIVGKLPFRGRDEIDIFQSILKDEPDFSSSTWQKVSPECVQTIKWMLNKKSRFRPSAKELFQSPYFAKMNEDTGSTAKEFNSVLDNMKTFKVHNVLNQIKNKLQAVIQTYFASELLSQEEKNSLIGVFRQIDQNNDGVISARELKDILKVQKLEKQKINEILKIIDMNDSGEINYTEFLVANFENSIEMTKDRMRQVFRAFDSDGNGRITFEEVAQFLGEYQEDQDEIEKIFQEIDDNGDGSVSEEEFIELVLNRSSQIAKSNSDSKSQERTAAKSKRELFVDKVEKKQCLKQQKAKQRAAKRISSIAINEFVQNHIDLKEKFC